MPGPKPKPTELKLMGGVRPCRINSDEPKPPNGRPECPSYVANDPEALAEWERIIPQLESMRVLTQADGPGIGAYCRIYSRYVKALKEAETGLTVPTGTGGTKTNPAIGIAERCEAAIYKALAEYGLTPSSRSRIKAGAKPLSRLETFNKQRPKKSG